MAQPETSVITDKMRAEIGVESEPVTFEVDKTACRMFARAVGYTDPIYFDEQYAKSKGYRGIPAPVGFLGHVVYNPNEPQSARGGAYIRTDTPFKRLLNGGTDIEYFDTVCAGDVLTATSKLIDLSEREGRLGPMLVTVTESTYRNQDGKLVARARGTGIQY
ncbi:MAG: MaoC family dehydratase N-terminal domain-containing protein [Chloroflexi bacterium]|nr:MaoC family dehydratase N-terminal domain-containing protein [Chloroflexota bacterium]